MFSDMSVTGLQHQTSVSSTQYTPIFSGFSMIDLLLVLCNTRHVSYRQKTPIFWNCLWQIIPEIIHLYVSTPADQYLFPKTRQYSLNFLWQFFLLYVSTPDQCLFSKTLQFSLNFLTDLPLVRFNTRPVSLSQNTPIISEFSDRSSPCMMQHQTSVSSTPDLLFSSPKTRQFSLNFLRQICHTWPAIFAKHDNILWIFCDKSSSCVFQHQTTVSSPKTRQYSLNFLTDLPLVRINTRPVSLRKKQSNFLWIFWQIFLYASIPDQCLFNTRPVIFAKTRRFSPNVLLHVFLLTFQHLTCDFCQNTTIFFEFSVTNLPLVRFNTGLLSLRQKTSIFSEFSDKSSSCAFQHQTTVSSPKTRQ